MDNSTFSESWHRLANQRLRLRPDVILRRQNFRGERWYVVEDPLTNHFFRIRPAAYDFLIRLGPDHTVAEVWQQCLERFPDSAPGQQECIRLLSQVYQANLLHYDVASDAAELFRRQAVRKERELKARLLGIMFARIPLFDPDRWLTRILPWVGKLMGRFGALLWLVVVGAGVKVVIDHWPKLLADGKGIVAPENLFLLYVGLILAKVLHELGHGIFCKKYGGQVHTLGVMLLIFTPVPYVDVTSSWSLRSRKERILISSAGMLVEVFLAAIAAQIWARSGPGAFHSVCYNIMFVASISTLMFNLNPLLRFDGYYILSDLLDIPNLNQRATLQLKHLWKYYVFGLRKSVSPSRESRERKILTWFGILSGIYRVVVFAGVLLLVADQFLILGIIMAVVCLISWILTPIVRLIRYLGQSPELDRVRPRAWLTTLGFAAAVLVFFGFVPFPSHFRAQGVVQAVHFREIVTEAPGVVRSMPSLPGQSTEESTVLLEMDNALLQASLLRSSAQIDELEARILMARSKDPAAIDPLEKRLLASRQQHEELQRDHTALTVLAQTAGNWSFLPSTPLQGLFLARGTSLGIVTQDDDYELVAAVLQTDADRLFATPLTEVEVKVAGQAEFTIPGSDWKILPGGRSQLPSLMLGTRGQGEIPVRADDASGRHATEPFYLIRTKIPAAAGAALRHGQLGVLRFRIGSEPLLPRWINRLRQFLLQRYRL
jgi:putative peptide zinc metalloprotease protein